MQLSGLSSEEARLFLERDGPNELSQARSRSLVGQVWGVVRQPMLLLLLAAGAVSFFLAEPLDGALLLAFVAVVIGISVVQRGRTEHAISALRSMASPRALVIRDGEHVRVPAREVVRGDVLLLAEGDRIGADGVILDCTDLCVDESALTGESIPVRKIVSADGELAPQQPGGEDLCWAFSGTLVVRGRGSMLVRETGAATAFGAIGTRLAGIEVSGTALQVQVNRIVMVISVIGLLAAIAVTVAYGLATSWWLEGALGGIAVAMAMLPEEFPVILTVYLTFGAWRLARRHVLARRPEAIEALGTASILCIDKTGTLTRNEIAVREVVWDGQQASVSDRELTGPPAHVAHVGILATPRTATDPLDAAFARLARRGGPLAVSDGMVLEREYPLSPALLAQTRVWRPPDGPLQVATKGAPEAVASLCDLSAEQSSSLKNEVDAAAAQGERVLAVASGEWPADLPLPADPRLLPLDFVGLVGMDDPIRADTPAAVAGCLRAGVRVVVVTGDYPQTAVHVAHEAGIDVSHGSVTGTEFASMDEESADEVIAHVNVFARMMPDHKLLLVRRLQGMGHVVAMTGDGVNDAPALRAADIGMAMGSRGTDVAREAAALVITDDRLGSMEEGIRLGRGIYDNMRKAMGYVIAVHIPILGMALLPLVVPGWPLVLLPVQIALLELIIDPACSLVFEAEEPDPGLMSRGPRSPDEPILERRRLALSCLQGLSVLTGVAMIYVHGVLTGMATDSLRSVTLVCLVAGNLALILANRSWRMPAWAALARRSNRFLPWIFGGAVVTITLLLAVPFLRSALGLGSLDLVDVALAIGAGVIPLAWFEIYKSLVDRSTDDRSRDRH